MFLFFYIYRRACFEVYSERNKISVKERIVLVDNYIFTYLISHKVIDVKCSLDETWDFILPISYTYPIPN